MINLPVFPSPKQNTILTIRRSYQQDVDDLTLVSKKAHPTVSQLSSSNLSLKVELSDPSSQKILSFLKCLLILSTLSQEALEEASKKLESFQQIYDLHATNLQKTSLPTTDKNQPQMKSVPEKNFLAIEEDCYYQESESPEIVNSFLSLAKSMPAEDDKYGSIYSDEELDSF